eukprot:TRINITY_DN112044_c0_g1_i1.p1 TRINITY_DN112044_c0_g1~~TRINITY_DN112044_c0_g1_i1.p1  ORF type:complete len:598 (-),score=105.92 TRINITY_DN112044_c0_g1_i1:154-1947(-)
MAVDKPAKGGNSDGASPRPDGTKLPKPAAVGSILRAVTVEQLRAELNTFQTELKDQLDCMFRAHFSSGAYPHPSSAHDIDTHPIFHVNAAKEAERQMPRSPFEEPSVPLETRGEEDLDTGGTARSLVVMPSMSDALSGQPLLTPREAEEREVDLIPQNLSEAEKVVLMNAYAADGLSFTLDDDMRPHPDQCWAMNMAQLVVTHEAFEICVGCVVLLNAASLGVATEYWAQHRNDKTCLSLTMVEFAFCFVFTCEWLLRVFAHGTRYFTHKETRHWNYLDTFLVLTQSIEQFMTAYRGSQHFNMNALRMLRALRLIRVTRLLRSFHLFDELRVIVSSIMSSASSLGWSVALLCCVIYIFTIILLQIILSVPETEHHHAFEYWFPSVFRTFLTLFECVVGGVSWDEVVNPLVEDIHPIMGVAFCIYVAIALFAMMNLLTGVFVDQAMRVVREDKDTVLARRIADLFLDDDAPEELTWEDFEKKVSARAMQEYFRQINVEASEARHLFELLDADGGGTVDSKEIVDGCLRLRGPARALDLMTVHNLIRDLRIEVNRFIDSQNQKPRRLSERDAKREFTPTFVKPKSYAPDKRGGGKHVGK